MLSVRSLGTLVQSMTTRLAAVELFFVDATGKAFLARAGFSGDDHVQATVGRSSHNVDAGVDF